MLTHRLVKRNKCNWWIVLPKSANVDSVYDTWHGYKNPRSEPARTIINVLRMSRLPYLQGCIYQNVHGTAVSGGPYVDVQLSPLAEPQDLEELQELIDRAVRRDIAILTRHRKKLTTFLPGKP